MFRKGLESLYYCLNETLIKDWILRRLTHFRKEKSIRKNKGNVRFYFN